MKTINQMRALLAHAYKMDFAGKSDAYVEGFYTRSCESGIRLDAAGNAIDPNDLDHRSTRGQNSAVRTRAAKPPLETLQQAKAAAAAIGAYDESIRSELAAEVLERLRSLGAERLADMYEQIWSDGGLELPSDAETNEEFAAKLPLKNDEVAASRKARNRTASTWRNAPSKADDFRARSPSAKRRSK